MSEPLSLQEVIMRLQQFWSAQGCVIWQPYNVQVGAGTLNLAPDWPVAPFVTIGVGGIHEDPRDEFIQTSKQSFHARAGGGILVSLRWRILFRLEAANVVLFTEDTYANVQSYFGGLGTYF